MPRPHKDWDLIEKMAERLRREPSTITSLVVLTGQTERTIYRWLRELEQQKFDVVRRRKNGAVVYSILSA